MPSTKRTYQSTLREEQAAATRRRILDAAAECFVAHGYAGTSLAAIARRAGVSVDTVQANGPKRSILLGAFERSFAGQEGTSALEGDHEFARQLAIDDPTELVHALTRTNVGMLGRIRRLWWAFRAAAASDPEVREVFDALMGRRRADHVALFGMLAERGVRIDEPERLTDEVMHVLSPETYAHFVDDCGWTESRFADWAVARVDELLARR